MNRRTLLGAIAALAVAAFVAKPKPKLPAREPFNFEFVDPQTPTPKRRFAP